MTGNHLAPTAPTRSRVTRLSPEAELELVALLAEGDEGAWRRFHALYDRLIYRCIRKVTQSFGSVLRSDDEAEIYANLIVQLLRRDRHKLRQFDPSRGSRLSSWLGLLATHAAYDYLRSIRREVPRVPLSEADTTRCTDASPLERVERKRRTAAVTQLVSRLSNKDREFVSLYFGRGLSPEDIAAQMNISVKTVYSKKHKIQSRLGSMAASQQIAA